MSIRMLYRLLLVVHVIFLCANKIDAADGNPAPTDDEKMLKEARLATDGPGLLAFLRDQSLSGRRRAQLTAAVRLLGDDAYPVREQAATELVRAGRAAVSILRPALMDPDLEIARRAERCLQAIEQNGNPALHLAAVRLLVERGPEGAAEALLAYLCAEEDEIVQEAVLQALARVGLSDGKPAAIIVATLTDRDPCRRSAAAYVVGRASSEHRQSLRGLLSDPDASVRFQAAAALLRGADRAAVPILIALLTDGPPALAWQAEDLLIRIAGEQAPTIVLGSGDKDLRGRHGAAWMTWWSAHEHKIDLARLSFDEPLLGLTVISEFDSTGKAGMGRIWECARDGKVRWQIDSVQGPVDVQVLPGGRFLVAEHQGYRVSERDRQGQIVWERRVANHPVSCQRLANGNTFIATYTELLEVTRAGNTVYSHTKPDRICTAQKLANGHILYIHNQNHFVELDAQGREVHNVAIGDTSGWAGIEPLADGRYLIALYNANKVVELDADGKIFWECLIKAPAWATRLPNGNTLVAGTEGNLVAEFDRSGKEVWKQATNGRPFRVRRR